MNETDVQHLKLLSIFNYILAALIALFSCIWLIYVVLGALMAAAPEKMHYEGNVSPETAGSVFIIIGLVLTLIGWAIALLIIITGRNLARYKHHTFCLVMAALECMVTPLGTALGIFSIIVLIRPSVKQMFAH